MPPAIERLVGRVREELTLNFYRVLDDRCFLREALVRARERKLPVVLRRGLGFGVFFRTTRRLERAASISLTHARLSFS